MRGGRLSVALVEGNPGLAREVEAAAHIRQVDLVPQGGALQDVEEAQKPVPVGGRRGADPPGEGQRLG